MRHAGGRLVEQHHFRIQRQRGGDLQRPLLPVGELARRSVAESRQPDVRQQRPRAIVKVAAARSPSARNRRSCRAPAAAPAARFPAPSAAGTPPRSGSCAPAPAAPPAPASAAVMSRPLKADASARGLQEFGQQIEAGGLARAVRADQGVDRAFATVSETSSTATKPLNSCVKPVGFQDDARSLAGRRPLLICGSRVIPAGLICISAAGWAQDCPLVTQTARTSSMRLRSPLFAPGDVANGNSPGDRICGRCGRCSILRIPLRRPPSRRRALPVAGRLRRSAVHHADAD